MTSPAPIAGGDTEQLGFHLVRAVEDDATPDELIEAITHLALSTGWPKAMSAAAVAREVLQGLQG